MAYIKASSPHPNQRLPNPRPLSVQYTAHCDICPLNTPKNSGSNLFEYKSLLVRHPLPKHYDYDVFSVINFFLFILFFFFLHYGYFFLFLSKYFNYFDHFHWFAVNDLKVRCRDDCEFKLFNIIQIGGIFGY